MNKPPTHEYELCIGSVTEMVMAWTLSQIQIFRKKTRNSLY